MRITATPRRVRLFAVSTTRAERELFDRTLDYARAVWQGSADRAGAALVAAVIARRAASSAAAARRTLERRLALLAREEPADPAESQLPWDEGDRDDDDPGDELLAMHSPLDRLQEIDWLRRLIDLASLASIRPSKIQIVRRLLRRTSEPLIVFSEYRDVVETVASAIGDLTTVAILHGGLSAQQRRAQLTGFISGRTRTLVTTDTAGEGLNLQAHCRLVVCLELPWKPLRMEQRIGRVDRIGQTRRVHAIQLFHRGSFEDIVRSRLVDRQLRSEPGRDANTIYDVPALGARDEVTPSSARQLRTIASDWASPGPARSPCAESGWPAGRTRVFLMFAATVDDGRGQVVERRVVTLAVDLAGHVEALSTIDLVGKMAGHQRVLAALDAQRRLGIDEIRGPVAEAAEAHERRLLGLLAAISRQTSHLTQGSLFDRRYEQRMHLGVTAREAWTRNLQRHLDRARAMKDLSAATARLVAAWIE